MYTFKYIYKIGRVLLRNMMILASTQDVSKQRHNLRNIRGNSSIGNIFNPSTFCRGATTKIAARHYIVAPRQYIVTARQYIVAPRQYIDAPRQYIDAARQNIDAARQ